MDVFLIGISGGSGSGKSTLATALTASLDDGTVATLPFDSYYRDLGHLELEQRRLVNFDHLDSLDVDLYVSHLDALRRGDAVGIPNYDFSSFTRTGETLLIEPAPLVVAEGILLMAAPTIAGRLDMSVYLDVPEAVRFERRMARDIVERGRDEADVRRQFISSVAPMHDLFVQPNGLNAEIVYEHPWEVMDIAAKLVESMSSHSSA